jgi:hypothetical protein
MMILARVPILTPTIPQVVDAVRLLKALRELVSAWLRKRRVIELARLTKLASAMLLVVLTD